MQNRINCTKPKTLKIYSGSGNNLFSTLIVLVSPIRYPITSNCRMHGLFERWTSIDAVLHFFLPPHFKLEKMISLKTQFFFLLSFSFHFFGSSLRYFGIVFGFKIFRTTFYLRIVQIYYDLLCIFLWIKFYLMVDVKGCYPVSYFISHHVFTFSSHTHTTLPPYVSSFQLQKH